MSEAEKHIDNRILDCISSEFKSCKDIAEELKEPEKLIYQRLRFLRKARWVTFIKSSEKPARGFPPTKYKKKEGI